VASPVVLLQVWLFVAPAFYRQQRWWAGGFVLAGSLLFLSGGAFAYWIVFPRAVAFLVGVGADFTAAVTGASYLSFLMTIVLGLGLMFELPLLIVALARMGVVTPRFLLRHFRWAVLIIFTVSAIITPTPDVFNLCLFAVPTLALYLLGVACAALVAPRLKKESPT
jgi:sec-independent protein translocase protein TatC